MHQYVFLQSKICTKVFLVRKCVIMYNLGLLEITGSPD